MAERASGRSSLTVVGSIWAQLTMSTGYDALIAEQSGFPTNDMELTTMLVVRDVARAKSFYLDVLGASLYREYGGTSVVMQLLGHWLLVVSGGEPTADKPTVALSAPVDPDRPSSELIFRVPDCRAAYGTLRARGAVFLTDPVDWGPEIRAFFRDPDGHLFEISELTGR